MQITPVIENDFHSNLIKEHVEYRVASNAKMMKMLSDGLYQDKIKAVIRELSTNARDSHVEAGNEQTPFEVHLPTRGDKTFKIRDYGTGMSPQKVLEMYREYGNSDKTKSNEMQGCLGLGSKSPFCYVKQFSSISYYAGKKYIFINAKNAEDVPTINFMHEENTEEPDGFEVSFKVHSDDIDEFLDKAKEVYKYFPVLPNCNHQMETTEENSIIKGDGWSLPRYNRNRSSLAIMGCVAYPIDVKHFMDKTKSENDDFHGRKVPNWYTNKDITNKYTELLNRGIILQFDIGEIEMDIGREGLQYHQLTIQAIKNKLDIIFKELGVKIEEILSKCTTAWEARCFLATTKNELLIKVAKIHRDINITKWGNTDISKSIISSNICDKTIIKFEGANLLYNCSKPRRTHNCYYIKPSSRNESTTHFYVNDVPRGAYAACLRKLESSPNDSIYLVTLDNQVAIDKFCTGVGINQEELVYVSKLPKPARVKRTKKDNCTVFKYVGELCRYNSRTQWDKTDVDFEKGGIYVEINNWQIRVPDKFKMPAGIRFYTFTTKLNNCVTVPIIYGVKTKVLQKFKNHPKWINIFDWSKNAVKTYIKTHKMEKAVAQQAEYNNVDIHEWQNYGNLKQLSPRHPIIQINNRYAAFGKMVRANTENVEAVCFLTNIFDIVMSSHKLEDSSIVDDIAKLEQKYPILKHVNTWGIVSKSKLQSDVCKYIAQVDSLNSKEKESS